MSIPPYIQVDRNMILGRQNNVESRQLMLSVANQLAADPEIQSALKENAEKRGHGKDFKWVFIRTDENKLMLFLRDVGALLMDVNLGSKKLKDLVAELKGRIKTNVDNLTTFTDLAKNRKPVPLFSYTVALEIQPDPESNAPPEDPFSESDRLQARLDRMREPLEDWDSSPDDRTNTLDDEPPADSMDLDDDALRPYLLSRALEEGRVQPSGKDSLRVTVFKATFDKMKHDLPEALLGVHVEIRDNGADVATATLRQPDGSERTVISAERPATQTPTAWFQGVLKQFAAEATPPTP
jgi:hypothetical protein